MLVASKTRQCLAVVVHMGTVSPGICSCPRGYAHSHDKDTISELSRAARQILNEVA